MFKLTPQRYLVAYSAVVTCAFLLTAYLGVLRPVLGASRIQDFDCIRAHRIDLIEPDGTVRLILSNRTDYPGSFFHGKEIARPDRSNAAGLLFINDEGTEDGGLIYGGKSKDGKPASFGHLSFDKYDQDQTLSLSTEYEDGKVSSQFVLGDQPDWALTPDVATEFIRVKGMPEGPERRAALADLQNKYPFAASRAILRKSSDNSVGLTLNDTAGHPRLKVTVAADGSPSIQLLDAFGKVVRTLGADSK